MKECLLLLLSTSHLHAQYMQGGKVMDSREFSDTPEDRASFADFLSLRRCPTYLLTDLIEEDFRLETIPYLYGRSHRALLQRKFDQFYRGTPFQQATVLQRQKTGRKDVEMLLSALTNPSLITPWIDLLSAHHIPLAGIYSVPQISTPLIQNHPSKHLLLITWNRFAGLRETYFSSHRLQISRLTPASEGLTFQTAVKEELGRTYQYLKSLSMLPAGQILDVCIVGHPQDLLELRTELPPSEEMNYEFIELAMFGKQLGIETVLQNSDATPIFLRQLAVQRPPSQYGNAEHTHNFDLWKLRRTLFWMSGALLIASVLWVGQMSVLQDHPNRAGREDTQQQILRLQNETRRIQQQMPLTDTPAADIKAAVLTLRTLQQRTSLPQTLLIPISTVMEQYPQIQLDELEWHGSATEPVASNTLAEYSAQILTLKGHIDDASLNYRLTIDYLEHFQHALQQQGFQVSVVKRPIDISPNGSLSDAHDSNQTLPAFVLRLAWRPAS